MSNLEREIQQIIESGSVAPKNSWILRYQVKGKYDIYWYYKLQCREAVFPSQRDSSKLSKYKHLGKPGSSAYNDAVLALARRAKIDALERMINSVKEDPKNKLSHRRCRSTERHHYTSRFCPEIL